VREVYRDGQRIWKTCLKGSLHALLFGLKRGGVQARPFALTHQERRRTLAT